VNAFEIAAVSMDADMQRLANIGQNLANVQTPGYKRVISSPRPFTVEMAAAGYDAGADAVLDTTAGALRTTANPLELAVQGDGFFVFDTPQGPALSRQAALHVDGQGRLVNDAGLAVRADRGDVRVTLPVKNLHVDGHGEVWADDRSVGRLQLVRAGNPGHLQPMGGGLYRLAADDTTQPIDTPTVLSGAREGSNVSSSAEMVRLMETTRHFEAMAKVVQGYDDAMDKAIRKLGDLGT
jgi:flagellar basal-body rod protein FlgG